MPTKKKKATKKSPPKKPTKKPPKPAPGAEHKTKSSVRNRRKRSKNTTTRAIAEAELPDGTMSTKHPVHMADMYQKLDLAYHAVVCEGRSLQDAAKEAGMSYSTLRYHAQKNKWFEARREYQALQRQARDSHSILDQAEAEFALAKETYRRCRERLEMFEKVLQLKWAALIADTKEETYTDASGAKHVMRVHKATAKEMTAILDLNKKLMDMAAEMAQFSEAKLVNVLRRVQRGRSTIDRRLLAAEQELMTRLPIGRLDDEA